MSDAARRRRSASRRPSGTVQEGELVDGAGDLVEREPVHLVALLGGRDVLQQHDVGACLDIVGGVVAPRRPHGEVSGEVPVEARLDLVGPGEPSGSPADFLGRRDLGDQRRRPGARWVVIEEQPNRVGDLPGADRLDADVRHCGVQDAACTTLA